MAVIEQLQQELRSYGSPERAAASSRFFKTKPGQYGYGDKFLGVSVPDQRKVAKRFYKTLSLDAVELLLKSDWHEERLTALFMLVLTFKHGDDHKKDQVANLYLANTKRVNNWDLVDSSASYILGPFLQNSPYKSQVLTKLAQSKNLWERRIAMLTTLHYITQGSADDALYVIGLLKDDQHDLIQKAVGWMLREIGKRVDRTVLLTYLDKNAATMPRVSLRYAIEHLPADQRKHYLGLKNAKTIATNDAQPVQ